MKQPNFLRRITLKSAATLLGCMTAAFAIGIQTAGDVRPVVDSTIADGAYLEGDLNGNGQLDIGDARAALEIAQGYRPATPEELAADPNGDFVITGEDVLFILEILERSPAMPIVSL